MKQNKVCRFLICSIVCVMAFFLSASSVFAVGTPTSTNSPAPVSSVEYEGGAEHFVFIPESTDLFQSFKDLIPGDTITQKITVKNTMKDKQIDIYLRAEPVSEEYVDFLSYMNLTVVQDGETVLSNAGAHTQGGLAENVLLGSFQPGEVSELDVTLEVSVEMGNEHQIDYGEIVWVFSVEEKTTPDIPTTGDKSNIRLAVILMSVSLIIIVFLLARTRRDKRKEKLDENISVEVQDKEDNNV